ncbi:MAG: M20/M25/M40 family metallo-hydrolase [Fimbriimonadaceae bacterium]|nr:M20/M25/M40 family metallo-hydrolase [Fimbriimonadaceae bacterium]
MKLRGLSVALLAAWVAPFALGQGDAATIARILDEGKQHNQVMRHLTYLTQRIGPRLTGSPQLQRACEWTAGKFREFGLQNVHLEEWGVVPVGFERGPRQFARMVKPFDVPIEFTTNAWTAGTKGLVRAPAAMEPATLAEFEKNPALYQGAWIVMRAPVTMRGPQAVDSDEWRAVQAKLDAAGIAGRIYGSADERVHTHGRFQDVSRDHLPKDVRLTVRRSDWDRMVRNLEFGRETVLEFDVENRFLRPQPVYNVVADIPGTEKPNEFVIFSAHLDSWNGPGSQGAVDNGTGTMVMLEAARILVASGAKPKRTIRFVLWSGEEQGLLGSAGYVEKHASELDGISAVFVDDGGTNYQGGVSCLESQVAMIKEALAPMAAAFPDLPQTVNAVPELRGGGSDHASFLAKGVPGFFFMETGRADYGFSWHTQNDRLEYAIPEYLVQSSTNSAVMAYNLACAPSLLPRK